MKVLISNIKSSPYRNTDVYPFIPGKIESLRESIQKSGLWKNMICRPEGNRLDGVDPENMRAAVAELNATLGLEGVYDGVVEIPWGHHRVEAARLEGVEFIYFTMESLTDDEMLYHLAAENKADYGSNMQVFLETVYQIWADLQKKVAAAATFADFKKEYGDRVYKTKAAFEQAKGDYGISSGAIQKNLGETWNQKDIGFALAVIKAVENGDFDRDHVVNMPSVRHMGEFVKMVSELKSEEAQKVYPTFFVNQFIDQASELISDPNKGVSIRVLEGVRNHIKGGKDPIAYLVRQTVKKFDLKEALDKLTGAADSSFGLDDVETVEGLGDFPDIDKVVLAVKEHRAVEEAKAAAKEAGGAGEDDSLEGQIAAAEGEAEGELGAISADDVEGEIEPGDMDESGEAVNAFIATADGFTGVVENLYSVADGLDSPELTPYFENVFKAMSKVGMVLFSKTALKKMIDAAEKDM